jgi:16S rRNA (cytidine1402-2'-O)-methyltransferase
VLPGPSAVVTALVASALPAERWRFAGFLPRRKEELRRELEAGGGETLVAFESPRRLAATLALLAEVDPERRLAVCRELTKLHEEVVRGTAAELARRFAAGARGEIVLVVGAAPARAAGEAELGRGRDAVERLVEAGAKRRAAAAVVSGLTGMPANRLYRAK